MGLAVLAYRLQAPVAFEPVAAVVDSQAQLAHPELVAVQDIAESVLVVQIAAALAARPLAVVEAAQSGSWLAE